MKQWYTLYVSLYSYTMESNIGAFFTFTIRDDVPWHLEIIWNEFVAVMK